MLLRFSKMHCLGDDLMLVELITQHAHISAADIQRWSHRSRGIGFKRLVVVEVPRQPTVDFYCRVFAPDGAELDCSFIELCCMARLLWEKKITRLQQLRFSSRNGAFNTIHSRNGWVRVEYPLQGFNELEFARSWPIDLDGSYLSERSGALSISQLEQRDNGCLRLELVKNELSLNLFFARQSVELCGWASRVFEGQVKL